MKKLRIGHQEVVYEGRIVTKYCRSGKQARNFHRFWRTMSRKPDVSVSTRWIQTNGISSQVCVVKHKGRQRSFKIKIEDDPELIRSKIKTACASLGVNGEQSIDFHGHLVHHYREIETSTRDQLISWLNAN